MRRVTKAKRGHLLLLLLAVSSMSRYIDAASHTVDNLLDFFPTSQDDGLNIIWAHGVNSHANLDESLSDGTMMLETDIILRGIGTENQTDIPVNAHPPATDSDLMVVDFINKTTRTPGKGMKLDFKYIEAVGPTMEIILDLEAQVNCPLWINADIVKGPNSPRDPVEPIEFIETANSYFDETVMSLGFTTDFGLAKSEDMYTWTMIFDILQYTYSLDPQPVTYPIRAVWCVRSWPKFTWLLGLRESFSITVWTGSADPVDIQGLISLRTHGDIRRIFYDITKVMKNNFLEAIETGEPKPDQKPASRWSKEEWIGLRPSDQKSFVFLSTESVGISGAVYRAGYLQSVKEYEALCGVSMVTLHGNVQFVDRYEASNEAVLEAFVRTDAIDGKDPVLFSEGYTPPSLRLQVGRNGTVKFGSESSMDLTCQLPSSQCYSFELIDRGFNTPFEAQVYVVTCSDAVEVDAYEGNNCSLSIPPDELPDFGDQSFVVLTKRGSSGDVIIENLAVKEADTDDPGGSAVVTMSAVQIILPLTMTSLVMDWS